MVPQLVYATTRNVARWEEAIMFYGARYWHDVATGNRTDDLGERKREEERWGRRER